MSADRQSTPARDDGRIGFREILIQTVLLAVLIAVLLPGVFLRNEVALPGTLLYEWAPWSHHAPADYNPTANETTIEILTQFALWYSLTKESLEQSEWPLWNNLELTGVPLLANCQSGVLYPFHILHAWLSVPLAMTLYVILKMLLCGLSAYVCGRVFGLRVAASRLISVAWMLCGFNMVWLYWPLPDVNAWLPILMIGAELLVVGRERQGFFTLAVGAVLLLLAGHPETAFACGAGTGLYFVVRLLLERRSVSFMLRATGLALGAWTIALLVCAAQLLPLAEYISHSHTEGFRAVSEKDRFFVTFGGIVAAWVPRFFGNTSDHNFWGGMWGDLNSTFQNLTYVGVPVLVCACLVFMPGRSTPRNRRQAIALVAAGGILLFLACNAPAVSWFNRLPLLRAMRGVYYVSFVSFALAALAGLGIERWWSKTRSARSLAIPALVIAIPTCGVLVLYQLYASTIDGEGLSGYVQWQIAVSVALAVATLLFLLPAMRPLRSHLWITLAAFVLALDLLYAARGLQPLCRASDVFVDTDLTRFLQEEEGPIRVEGGPAQIRTGILSSYGIDEQWGYDGIFPRRIMEFYALADKGTWQNTGRIASVTHYVFPEGGGPEPDGRWQFVQTIDGLDLYRDTAAFPRAFQVPTVRCLPEDGGVLNALVEPDFDPMAAALTDWPHVSMPSDAAMGSIPTETRVLDRGLRHTTVAVSSPRPTVLVLTEAWYPGWKATVSGEPADVFPAYHAFRGVTVPPGEHVVRFEYDPLSFKLGLGISLATMAVSVLASGAGLVRLRRESLASGG